MVISGLTHNTWETEPVVTLTISNDGAVTNVAVAAGGDPTDTAIAPHNLAVEIYDTRSGYRRPTATPGTLYHVHSEDAAEILFGTDSDIPSEIAAAETRDELEFIVGAIDTALRGTARTTAFANLYNSLRDVPTLFAGTAQLRRGVTVYMVAGHADAIDPTTLLPSTAANAVVTAMEAAAESNGAIVVIGATQATGANVVAYANANKGGRVFILADGESETAAGVKPTAPYLIAGIGYEDEAFGIQHFWSDVPVLGISRPRNLWTADEINTMIQAGVNVLAVGRNGQWHLSTQYLSGASPTSVFRFAHVRRIADEMQYQGDRHFDVVRHLVAAANDAGRTATMGEILESYQALFDGFVASGVLVSVEIADDETSDTDLSNGTVRLSGTFGVRIGLQEVRFTLTFRTTLV